MVVRNRSTAARPVRAAQVHMAGGEGGGNSSYISYISYNISRRFELELFLQNLYIRGRGQTPLTSLTSLTISPAVLNNKTLPNSYRTYI